jgi:ABC-type lipoprotein release transport system permease subunit
VSVAALVVVLLPYLVGVGMSKGIEAEAESSARFGADLYVTGRQFGRPVPVPLEAVAGIRKIDGVTDVAPRIVGEVLLGTDQVHAVLVGLPREHMKEWAGSIDGDLPRTGGPNEMVVGSVLARRLGLGKGSRLLPFYHNDQGERLSLVVGVFRRDAPLWQAYLILTTFETAAHIFAQQGLATDLLVWCRPNYQSEVGAKIARNLSFSPPGGVAHSAAWAWSSPRFSVADCALAVWLAGSPVHAPGPKARARVTAREDLLALLPRGPRHREGLFSLHFVLAFAVGILVLLVTSGLGLAERRREIGILKATGWQTDEVLLRGAVESLCLSVAGACIALLLAWVWLRLFNGFAIASFFLAGVGTVPDFAVPFRLTPIPVLLAFVLSFVVVLTGTLFSAWLAAVTAPREAMR